MQLKQTSDLFTYIQVCSLVSIPNIFNFIDTLKAAAQKFQKKNIRV